MRRAFILGFALAVASLAWATPVTVVPVAAKRGMVVAAHPQAAAIGAEVLRQGGNAIDAGVAVSLAVGVAEPYGSGLGGKLMLLYYEAKTGRTVAVDAMDAAGSLDVAAYLRRPTEDRAYGYGSVCVPGLAAGLSRAHQQWGVRKWAEDIAPAITLAREGFEILPKTLDQFEEQLARLRRGDAEIARIYLPGGKLPAVGDRLKNEDLARTMERLAAQGPAGFYRGEIAEKFVAASQRGGGALTLEDLARYEARLVEPLVMEFRGNQIFSAPPPASGASLYLTIMKALEADGFGGGPLRTAVNLDRIGRVWRVVEPQEFRLIADAPESRRNFENLISPESVRTIRDRAAAEPASMPVRKAAALGRSLWAESPMAATTQWMVVDAAGNIACATQSLSLHFGAGVVPPGTGVVLNDSMSNLNFEDPKNLNFIAPGKRPRSTIAPTIVTREGRPFLVIGVPGSTRIPTAMLQVLLDRLALNRPLADAIGDTRVHFRPPYLPGETEMVEAERSLPEFEVASLQARGWKVSLPEEAGRGRRFGGVNAIEIGPDGTLFGYADPRRTNAAAGY